MPQPRALAVGSPRACVSLKLSRTLELRWTTYKLLRRTLSGPAFCLAVEGRNSNAEQKVCASKPGRTC